LIEILSHLVKMLKEQLSSSDSSQTSLANKQHLAAESHTFGKASLISTYEPSAACRAFFDPDLDITKSGWIREGEMLQPSEIIKNVYTFDCFTDEFCNLLVAELENFEQTKLPKRRPNSMNNFGLVINDIGLAPLVDKLVESYFRPLAEKLFLHEPVALGLDHHHSFIVEYREQGGDQYLDMHHDASEITVNVCLGLDFQGSGLRFCGEAGSAGNRKEVNGQTMIGPY